MKKIMENTIRIGNLVGLVLGGVILAMSTVGGGFDVLAGPIWCFWCGVAFVFQFGKYYLKEIGKGELIFKTICIGVMSILFYFGAMFGTISYLFYQPSTGALMLIGYFIAPLLVCYGIGYLIFGQKNKITISREEYNRLKQNQIQSKGGYLEPEENSKN